MIVGLIHLSDIHLKSTGNSIFNKTEKLVQAINSELYSLDKLLLVISGDVAFSGRAEEFDLGLDLINDLIEQIKFPQTELVIIPGNHDCDFSADPTVREILMNDRGRLHEPTVIKNICSPLKNYFEFEEVLLDNLTENEKIPFKDELFKQYKFEVETKTIYLNCFNTAWFSSRHEKPGTMSYPIANYTAQLKHTADLSIAVLHHPLHWIEPNEKRNFETLLRESNDVILTGHEHTSTQLEVNDLTRNKTLHLEGSALQTNNPEESSFSIIKIDLNSNALSKIDFIWNSDMYIKELKIEDQMIQTGKTLQQNSFRLKAGFSSWLNDVGVSLKHPKINNLTLSDLYVCPDVKQVKFDDKENSNSEKRLSLEDIDEDAIYQKLLVVGEENFGKTSFCKVTFMKFHKKNLLPIYINGESLRHTSIIDFNKLIDASFKKQYEESKLLQFQQLSNEQKVVIIDNIDRSPLQDKYKNQLMIELEKYYPHIIMTAREIIKFQGLFDDYNTFHDFTKLEILPFGHGLRGELIEKWNLIGASQTEDQNDFVKTLDHYESTVSTIIGNNFVPSLPFFVLVIMQSVETDNSNLSESAYGHYYEYLIKQSLININLTNKDTDAFNNYVIELAFKFFEDEITEISQKELKAFHDEFNDKYDLSLDFKEYETNLFNAAIVTGYGDAYSFKYKYVYYYYVAKYLSQNITEDYVIEIVENMCKKLYIEEFSNIIMFLTHLSKNPLILHSVCENAKIIFQEIAPAQLDSDIRPLNALISDIPDMVIKKQNALEARKERRSAIDEAEMANKENGPITPSITEEKRYEEFDIIGKMNWAMKTIEIMGQILKNYYGSTPGNQKMILGEEAYNLGLRSLNTFLNIFSENRDNLLEEIERILEEQEISEKEDIEKTSRQFVFSLMSSITHYFIKKISDSVGTENLVETYQKILEKNNTPAVQLISLSLNLDHMHHLPIKEIEHLKKDFLPTNFIAYNVVRGLVINHLYLFQTDYKERQKVYELLNISESTQKKLALSSHK